ncbi:MAG: hypothetical protein KatS3mg110_2996 [Pirellulaceae bacterium]|nr:MAG: hypothetical protein KatS3mg110_2996 [Pirellulaceae bacterium]
MIAGKQPLVERQVRAEGGAAGPELLADPYVARCREVLRLWLRWDQEQRQLTERMFGAGCDQAEIEQLLDECELLRQAAVQATEALLSIGRQDEPGQ